jgi:GNAT superfamily N-acetyltransferase
MKKRVGAAYLLVPVLYLAVIVGLLFLQFSGGQRFHANVGALTVTGATQPGTGGEPDQLTRLQIEYNGIAFPFDEESTLVLQREENGERRLRVRSYNQIENGFVLEFEQDVTVRFEMRGEDVRELQVRPVIPPALLPLSGLQVPFQLHGDAEQTSSDVPGVLAVQTGDETFYLAPPPRTEISTEPGALQLPGGVAEQTVRYTRVSDSDQPVVEQWFSSDQLAIPDGEYRALIEDYVDRAYEGWSDARYNGGSATWDMRGGSPRFEERIVVAYLTEAWARDEYTVALNDMRRAADLHPQEVGLPAATYLGDLRNTTQRVRAADQERTQELLSMARNENPELFLTPHLVRFAADRGSPALLEAVLSYAERANYRATDMVTAIGMLRAYVEAGRVSEEIQTRLSGLRSIVEERVLPALVRIDEGFFVRTAAGQVDIYNSVLVGALLTTIADAEPDAQLRRIGRNLVRTALSYTDDSGYLPRVFFTGNGALQGTEGVLGPEAIYPLITNRPHFPRERSLYNRLGQGSWIWSAAPVTDVRVTDQQYRFGIDNTPNRTHYIVIQGVPPFGAMELFGQQWRDDPSFESYIKGRHYNRNSRTLMIKYTDPDPNGSVILYY